MVVYRLLSHTLTSERGDNHSNSNDISNDRGNDGNIILVIVIVLSIVMDWPYYSERGKWGQH